MIKSKIKKLYNKILFKIYKGRNFDYEELILGKFNRPFLFCTRLYSPSLYCRERGKYLSKCFMKGFKKGLKDRKKIKIKWEE